MAQIQQSIVGYELGQAVPASGICFGWLLSPNGYNTTDITTDSKRSGTYGFKAAMTAGTFVNTRVQFVNATTGLPAGNGVAWEMRMRYYFRIVTTPDANNLVISYFGSGVPAFEIQLQMNTSRQIRVVPSFCSNVTSAYSGTLTTNVWYQARIRVYGIGSAAGGTASPGLRESSHDIAILSEDGSSTITSFSGSTITGNNMPLHWPAIGDLGQGAITAGPNCTREIHYDDWWFHMATDSDVAAMEWPRGTNVEVYVPTANGATNNFTRGGVNTGANWSQVSEIPRASGGSTQYVVSGTAGHYDLYQHANLADSDDVVYHIQALGYLYDDTQAQKFVIGATEYDVEARDGVGVAKHGIAHQIYSNASTLSSASFNALEFGLKKQNGATNFFCEQFFLEVLTGPPNIIEEDLPDPGDPTAWSVTAAFDLLGGLQYAGTNEDLTIATSTLGFRIGGQGVEINVPTPWNVQQIQIGYRDEETS